MATDDLHYYILRKRGKARRCFIPEGVRHMQQQYVWQPVRVRGSLVWRLRELVLVPSIVDVLVSKRHQAGNFVMHDSLGKQGPSRYATAPKILRSKL